MVLRPSKKCRCTCVRYGRLPCNDFHLLADGQKLALQLPVDKEKMGKVKVQKSQETLPTLLTKISFVF